MHGPPALRRFLPMMDFLPPIGLNYSIFSFSCMLLFLFTLWRTEKRKGKRGKSAHRLGLGVIKTKRLSSMIVCCLKRLHHFIFITSNVISNGGYYD